jgi:hypothetical protein
MIYIAPFIGSSVLLVEIIEPEQNKLGKIILPCVARSI